MHNLKFQGNVPIVPHLLQLRNSEDADAVYDDTGHLIPVTHPLPVVVSEDARLSSERGPLPPASARNGRNKPNAGANVQVASGSLPETWNSSLTAPPVALLNAIIDTVAANKDGVRDLVDRTKHRLEMIDAALLKRVAEEWIERFSRVLIIHANELVGLLTRSLLRRIWESDEDVKNVKEIFVQAQRISISTSLCTLKGKRQPSSGTCTFPHGPALDNADLDSTLSIHRELAQPIPYKRQLQRTVKRPSRNGKVHNRIHSSIILKITSFSHPTDRRCSTAETHHPHHRVPARPPFAPRLDALDECEEGYECSWMSFKEGGLPGLKFLVTSRPSRRTLCAIFTRMFERSCQ